MQIRAEHLTKLYGNTTALNDVSLAVEDGELFFLLGPSGCGKTTLLRIIGGFEQPTSGEIYLGGKAAGKTPPSERDTAMVFQGYALWPHLTVRQNIAFGLEMRKLPAAELNARVEQVLKELQIQELADRKPNQLSGGQQQRVALARTLVVHPGGFLLDEPLANLDAKLRRDMRLEIRRICKDNGLTGIYVTHDRAEALSMADRIAVFRNGQIEQIGTPREVYRRPQTPFVANFIGETNLRSGKLLSRESDGSALLETPLGVLRSRVLPDDAKPGESFTLSMRPEAFHILSDGADEANAISVTITNVDYLGEMAEHLSHDAAGGELKFFELNPAGTMRTGEAVRLSIAPDDVVCMKEKK
ncbi:MAG: ABC transporter ATP-binding protein [Lentisphaeria bacterium]|nr:ABC transporter ATP-binding protein [Lentisphaeria bacterium]